MPINGLTNRPPSFPEIGQLRKGAPKPNEKQPGKDLTFFRFTSDIPEVQAAFDAAYDGEPRLINVFLPFRSVDDNMDAWQEEYRAGGLVHRCNGETVVLWQKSDGSYSHDSKPCEYASGKKQRSQKEPGCKPVGRLKVIIPELGRLAYVTVLTTSTHDIRNLDAQLRALAGLSKSGDLRGIPLQLRRRPNKISTPSGDGKRVRREKWLLSIEAAPDWVALQLAAQAQAALPEMRPMAALPAPAQGVTVIAHTGEIVAAPGAEDWEDDDAEEGEWAVPPVVPSEPEEPKEKPATNGAPKPAPARPLDAAKVRQVVRKKAGWPNGTRITDGEPLTPAQQTAVVAVMTEACRPSQGILSGDEVDGRRHAVLDYLFGIQSTKSLSKAEASAILDWLTLPDSTELNGWAGREVATVFAAYQEEQGQQSLPL